MGLLKKDTKRKNYKLVGVTLPSRVHSYLSLYALAKATTKSSIFKELILSWLEEQRQVEDDSELIEQIITRVHIEWEKFIKLNPHSNMVRFKETLNEELISKGIEEKYIDTIIKTFE